MKACYKCGFVGKVANCPHCGTRLGEIVFQSPDEIIVKVPDILFHTPERAGILAFGLHVGCGGSVDTKRTSSGKLVLLCRECALRVVKK